VTPRLVHLTFGGPDLEGLVIPDLAASVRLLLPSPATGDLVIPTWNGNEFLLPDGQRPILRTFTPRRLDTDDLELDLEIVIHGHGVASQWAASSDSAAGGGGGGQVAISGPGRGYAIDADASTFLLAGDETAIPAISQLIEAMPADCLVQVHIEVGGPSAKFALPEHPQATVAWHELPAGAPPGDTLLTAVEQADVSPALRVWAAGEAAAMQRIRRHLFADRGLPRTQAVIRGYWKHGRAGDADEDA
jgi:NADPH-dependent ferric siderophore reductase